MAPQAPRRTPAGRLVWMAAAGIAFGQIEAVVTVYVRHLMDWVPLPGPLGHELLAELPGWLVVAEQTRQVATLLMLLAIAALTGRIFLEKVATFLFAAGVCGVTYYTALRVMIGWPESLSATDCLVLIPQAWFAPVWLALCIALGMIAVASIITVSIERYSAKYGAVGK